MERADGITEMTFLPKHKGIEVRLDEVVEYEKKSQIIRSVILDEKPAEGGDKRTQHKWICYWNTIEDGRVMASMGDFYLGFKQLKDKYIFGNDSDRYKIMQVVDSFRNALLYATRLYAPRISVITSTRVTHNCTNLNAKVIHHYKCHDRELVKKTNIDVPICERTSITKVVNDFQGLSYLQTLFDTSDDAEKIMQTIEFMSGDNRNNIKIWNHADVNRDSILSRATGFCYVDNNFGILGSVNPRSTLISYGVLINKNS